MEWPALDAAFEEAFTGRPSLRVRAPGRVNLIGEHTDYNDGFALPMAIDLETRLALRPRRDGRVRVRSLDFSETREFDPRAAAKRGEGWLEYFKGIAWSMLRAGLPILGWDGVLAGDVPIGAGLASSAALELAAARAFAAASDLPWDPIRMARLARQAENEWIGVRCGIMDPLVSAAARAGHASLIDCRSLAVEAVPLPPGVAVVVLDTSTRRELTDSAYNERRAACEQAARRLGVAALRDAQEDRLGSLEGVLLRRARHVVSENARTIRAAREIRNGNAAEVGRLMNASHESLRDDHEVSSPALDAMVAAARAQPGCLGARMTGAGFGGCAVALVERSCAGPFLEGVVRAYRARTGLEPRAYPCEASEGAGLGPGG